MLRQYIQIVLEGLALQVKVDENEASPSGHFHLRQAHVAVGDVLKVPVVGDALELAIEVPGRTMERDSGTCRPSQIHHANTALGADRS